MKNTITFLILPKALIGSIIRKDIEFPKSYSLQQVTYKTVNNSKTMIKFRQKLNILGVMSKTIS